MTCPLCGEKTHLDFHHWQYKPVSRRVEICRSCHNFVHDGRWGRGHRSGNRFSKTREEQEKLAQEWSDSGGVDFEGWRDLAFANLIWAHYDMNEEWPNSVTDISDSDHIQLASQYEIPKQFRQRLADILRFVVRYQLLKRTNLNHNLATLKAAKETLNTH
jgi:hypothetical protein